MSSKLHYPPCLLDRLIDNEPRNQLEQGGGQIVDARQMRNYVQRDLLAVLNSSNIEDRLNSERHHHVAESVINFGVTPLVGNYETSQRWLSMEKAIRWAILRFEQRVIPESLIINSLSGSIDSPAYGIIMFEIRALIYWNPNPLDLVLNGTFDTGTDRVGFQ